MFSDTQGPAFVDYKSKNGIFESDVWKSLLLLDKAKLLFTKCLVLELHF